jgi:hypothetical protein
VTATAASVRLRGRRAQLVARVLPFIPAFAVAAISIAWAAHDGGYFPVARYTGALVAAGLLLTLAIARPPGAFTRSPAVIPLALLAAWTAWNGISLVWTAAPDSGWDSTNELLTVVLMGAVVVATPWRTPSATALVVAWAAGVAAIALVDLTTLGTMSDPGARLLESRYLGPIGYANGTAALGGMAFWPLLAVAAGPRFAAPVRLLALPAAMLVLAWALLPQSRGTMLAGFAVLPLFLALSSHRIRVLARLLIVTGGLAIAVPALFDVYTASRQMRPLDGVVETAVERTAVAVALTLVASAALLALERLVRPSERGHVVIRRLSIGALGVALIGAGAYVTASHERIQSGLSDRWHTFSSNADAENTQTGARIGQVVADKRYDYWTVALDAFTEHPITGIGAGGFEQRYAAHKRYAKHSRYTHDIWLRALSETGVVGLALLVAALTCGLTLLIRARRRAPTAACPAIAATAALGAAFFMQCSVDWLEEVPALLAPAVCLPLAVIRARWPGLRLTAGPPAAAALAVVAVAAMVLPYLSALYVNRGDDLRADNPRAALVQYSRAASVDPVAVEPHLSSGFVALALDDTRLARRSFQAALRVREDWVARFELGLIEAQAGRRGRALAQLERAAELNRNDDVVTEAIAAVEKGERLDPREVNRSVLSQPVLGAPP